MQYDELAAGRMLHRIAGTLEDHWLRFIACKAETLLRKQERNTYPIPYRNNRRQFNGPDPDLRQFSFPQREDLRGGVRGHDYVYI